MIEWSEADLAVRDAVRDFIEKEIRPHVDLLETGQMPPYDIVRKLFAAFGIDAMAAEALKKQLEREREPRDPEQKSSGGVGGLAGGGMESMVPVVVSEIAGVSLGVVGAVGVSLGLGAGTIMAKGTLAQKERWLPKLVTFEHVAAWAITEPESGSDAFGGMKTTVKRDGDDYILKGRKTFITNGPDADVIVVYAKLDEGDPSTSSGQATDLRDKKVLTFVLERGMPGLIQSKPFKKMGMMSSPTGELTFDGIRLTKDHLLGETEDTAATGDGRESARSNFVVERIGVAAISLGIINECLRLCTEYAKSRELWGKPIGDFQLIQLKLAKMEVARINVQNMVFRTLEMARAGKTPTLGEASAMKWYSSEAATEVAMEAVQLFGGNGYMAEYRVEQLARDAKSMMIYAGSNEIQITHVAKEMLRG
ncbi:acyl-CoA dehydrogenase family protein [Nocardioides marmorisolisilvae]|uniref:Acyl-CoA dehydrogenase n=1 Tax=Nocardioides marmorisolisilvae TaxID=1542737 RepID=A0A3N0DZT1_9ACTN|nr:acyl-CoA dehydrogenase family protein [Nocardioides marmorisolisilvae]RNL81112.1 acyl-CoA dehydrogenase [Nocardioides marmorisolisilvae]